MSLAAFVLLGAASFAAWSQEAQNAKELAKQQKIYGSKGTEVPDGYVTGRAFSDYVAALPKGFCGALSRLRSSDRWLDVGAGAGGAILDYHASAGEAASVEKCAGSGTRAHAVGVSIEDRRTDAWRRRSAKLGDDRLRYFSGKRMRDYSVAELGKFQLITDVYGAFSYTDDLSGFMDRILSLLEVGGTFFSLVQSVHLENGRDDPNTYYLTQVFDQSGQEVKVCSWLKRLACAQVTCESHTDWHTPTELVEIRKVCSGVSVPQVKLLKYEAGSPPARQFRLEPRRADQPALVPVRAQ